MQRFTALFLALDQTNKTNTKVQALVQFFNETPPEDKVWCIALLSGKRPKKAIRSNDIREWTAEASGLPIWLFEETYHIVGDLAEAVAKVLPDPENIGPDRSLTYWMEYIMALRDMELLERKRKILAAWRELDAWQRFVVNKMMMGFFVLRVGRNHYPSRLQTRPLQHLHEKRTSLNRYLVPTI